MKYAKPHLNYNAQLDLLRQRGLSIGDERAAVRALRRIGYYRLSAYTYVLRRAAAPGPSSERLAPSDQFIEGATLDQAVALHDFDDRLRGVLLSGLERIEVAMRVQIGYQLGKTDPHGHLDPAHLDAARCGQLARTRGSDTGRTLHAEWLRRFDALLDDARTEEFVRHFVRKYDGRLPIWAATEIMTFGCLTGLYNLLSSRDAAAIALALEVKNRDVVHGWLRALNVLRNHCAHNARVWNRPTVYPPRIPPPGLTHARLHHLPDADNNRVYVLAAIIGHLLVCLDPTTNWPRQLATVVKKFPAVSDLSPGSSMGFPDGWQQLELWNYEPT